MIFPLNDNNIYQNNKALKGGNNFASMGFKLSFFFNNQIISDKLIIETYSGYSIK